jgi:type I restriction enzyme S subunit
VLPNGWQDRYLSQTCDEQFSKNIGNKEDNVLSLSYGKIIRKKNKYGGLTPTDFATYQIVEPGNIILRLTDLQNDHTSLRTGLVRERGIITSAYCCLKPWEKPEYLQYLLHAYDTQKHLYGLGGGVRQSIGFKDIRYIHLPLPPREEQDQIVRYLDWKVSQVNQLINAKKKQIRLLQEQKQGVINAAVTKGLNPDAPMKDSGMAWLGMIPEHWSVVYSKKLFFQRKERARPDDQQLTASQKYGIILQSDFMKEEERRVTVVLQGEDILKHVESGDFVISMRSFQGGLEYSYVSGKISSAYVMIATRNKAVCDEYYKWLFKSTAYISALQGTSDLVRDGQALRYANFSEVYLPDVPYVEQVAIAGFLNIQSANIDNVIKHIEHKVILLHEYRTRLIFDVVTGKLDVRGVEVPEFESIGEAATEDETQNEGEADDTEEE